MTVLKTTRLLLRPLEPQDTRALTAVFGDPEVMRFGDGIQTETWVSDWIEWVRQGCAYSIKNEKQNLAEH